MTHDLKTVQPYFDAVVSGAKTFEIRKDDRGFEVGDDLELHECVPQETGTVLGYTGRSVSRRITYITYITDFPDGLREGYVVFGLANPEFWAAKTIAQLSAEQGTKPIESIAELEGIWPGDAPNSETERR